MSLTNLLSEEIQVLEQLLLKRDETLATTLARKKKECVEEYKVIDEPELVEKVLLTYKAELLRMCKLYGVKNK